MNFAPMLKPWICAALLLTAFIPPSFAQNGSRLINLDDIWKKGTFSAKSVPGFNALPDGERYTQTDENGSNQEVNIYSLKDGKKLGTLFSGKSSDFDLGGYTISEDEKKLLIYSEGENIYRRSVLHAVRLYDVATKQVTRIAEGKVLHAQLSPDGKHVAYVKDNNLYLYDVVSGNTRAITTDGRRNEIINGNCDWVYEEEFEFTQAYEWSKDSRYLAFYRFDESQVPTYTMTVYDSLYPTPYTYKYPKTGDRNSEVTIHTYNLQTGATTQMQTVKTGGSMDHYIPRIKWSNNPGKLLIYKLNRHQNHLDFLMASAATGKTEKVYSEDNPYYIDINDNLTFLKDNESCILTSDRDGWTHLYRYNFRTRKSQLLTPGQWDVEGLMGVDEKQQLIYFTAAKVSPARRELYVTDYRGKGSTQLTRDDGYHAITPCAGNHYFLDRFSSLGQPPVFRLIDAYGDDVRVLENNSALRKKMQEYKLGDMRMTRVVNDSDEVLNGWMMYPPDFDENKKYPVLMFQYSGPGSQQAVDRFPTADYFWHQMLAEQGYIIACFDGTGTGMRGQKFRKKTYLQMGKLESADQIAVAKALGRRKYVDAGRIGIWGWSYGGFMSSTCIFKAPDVFKAAIAVAPVTNWRYYDNIYTERYMRTPQENPGGYDDNAPEKLAKNLRGKFLLIHGTGDDNVHVQNSMSLIDELVKANKDYDSEFYPNRNHGIYGGNTRLHLYRRMTEFILENL